MCITDAGSGKNPSTSVPLTIPELCHMSTDYVNTRHSCCSRHASTHSCHHNSASCSLFLDRSAASDSTHCRGHSYAFPLRMPVAARRCNDFGERRTTSPERQIGSAQSSE